MTKININLIITLIFILTGCSGEKCKIDFENSKADFEGAIDDILKLKLKMNSNESYSRPNKTIHKEDSIVKSIIFNQIDYIECHEDSTIIFQAKNCNQESALRDVVYFLAYSPKGEEHLKRKRNTGAIENISGHWYLCEHINTLAN